MNRPVRLRHCIYQTLSPPLPPSHVVLDDNLITEASEGGHYGFLVHSGETVRIPFKYQCFSPVERTSSQLEDGSSNKQTLSVGRGASGEKFFKVRIWYLLQLPRKFNKPRRAKTVTISRNPSPSNIKDRQVLGLYIRTV